MRKNHSYFEGWYFKLQNSRDTLALIPGVHRNGDRINRGFIQVIFRDQSWYVKIPYEDFHYLNRPFRINMGANTFNAHGVYLAIEADHVQIKGRVDFGPFTPLKYDIMGPFAKLPFMECKHGVLSMGHSLTGVLMINGETVDFHGGTGYIEKDAGTSFPKSYLWVQCNRFQHPDCSVMVSIADIPLGPLSFRGCIGVVHFDGTEHRFATYLGVKTQQGSGHLCLRQGKQALSIDLLDCNAHPLKAPDAGDMVRTIHENTDCRGRFRFASDRQIIFDFESDRVAYEVVEPSFD